MEIKLIQSGGILPITKEATIQVDWTADERQKFLDIITMKGNIPSSSATRDGIDYTVEIDNTEMPIDLNNLPSKYAGMFNVLTKNLKIVKP